MTNAFLNMLDTRDWILADGATGTNLFNMGLSSGDAPELWNETHPDNIRKLYQMAVDAGSDLFLTNSFGGNSARLKLHDAGHRARELSRLSVELGREVADTAARPVVVAASVGPTGEILEPVGSISHADCVEIFLDQAIGIPTHFIKRLNMREQLVRKCEIIPLEVIVRNYAAGSISKRLGIEEGTQMPRPIVEYCYKDDSLGDPLVTEEHIAAFGWASQQDMEDILSLALRVNDFMSGLMLCVGIRLVDFKIEIGRVYEGDYQRLVIADEISPDSCRLWDIETGRKLDKDVFRRDLGNLTDAYSEVARRLGVLPKTCLLYTSPSPRDLSTSRMPSSA